MSNLLEGLWRANELRDAEWDPDHKITLSFRGMELAGEVGELCNQLKKIARVEMDLRGSSPDYEKLYEELADSMICISLICMHLNISVDEFEAAVRAKFNKTSDERGLAVKL